MNTSEVAATFNVKRQTIHNWISNFACPAPPAPRSHRIASRTWSAADVARLRAWREERKVARVRRDGGSKTKPGVETQSAKLEAVSLLRRVRKGHATPASVLHEIGVTSCERTVLLKLSGFEFLAEALAFRRQVRVEFLKLVQKDEKKNAKRDQRRRNAR
ncbi:MAG: hypothetical protein ABSH48_27550 [Verrucomicrobiota bacterium]|jgi:hypothetical protein